MVTKYGVPFTQYRVFNNKRYTYLSYEDTKRNANARAKSIRSLGSYVRVTREVSPLGKAVYALWTRR